MISKLEPFPLTYRRGNRHVLVSHKIQGAIPSTSTKKLEKGKENIIDEEEEDKHETEQEFQLIHLDNDDENEARITRMLLKRKYAQIKYL